MKLDCLHKYKHITAKFQLVGKVIDGLNRKDINNREENYIILWKHTEVNASPDDLQTKYSRLNTTVLEKLNVARMAYDDCESKNKYRGEKKRKTKMNALKTPHAVARICNSSQFRKLAELQTSPSC